MKKGLKKLMVGTAAVALLSVPLATIASKDGEEASALNGFYLSSHDDWDDYWDDDRYDFRDNDWDDRWGDYRYDFGDNDWNDRWDDDRYDFDDYLDDDRWDD